MNQNILLALICLGGLFSCILPREARQLKSSTLDWRESSIVLEGYVDSPFSGSFLKLRENGKFEHTTSGLTKSFRAGSLTINYDTIILSYRSVDLTPETTQKIILDSKAYTMDFENAPIGREYRVVINKL